MLDIFKCISLYMNAHKLSLVCKSFNNIYDELWYKQKLTYEYDTRLWIQTTYQDLYKKSLQSGNIVKYTCDKNSYICGERSYQIEIQYKIQGIKITKINNEKFMILTFNGDLWIHHNDLNYLLDSEVIDIDHNIYCTTHECYVIRKCKRKHLMFTTNESLLSVAENEYYMVAISKNTIYLIASPYEDSIITNFKIVDNIIKVVPFQSYFAILATNNDMILFDQYDKKLSDIRLNKVKYLFPEVCILYDNSIVILDINGDLDSDLFGEITDKTFKITQIILDDIQYCVDILRDYIILSNDTLYHYNTETFKLQPLIINLIDNIKLKNITTSMYTDDLYIIY